MHEVRFKKAARKQENSWDCSISSRQQVEENDLEESTECEPCCQFEIVAKNLSIDPVSYQQNARVDKSTHIHLPCTGSLWPRHGDCSEGQLRQKHPENPWLLERSMALYVQS